jgi:hypothetical protein
LQDFAKTHTYCTDHGLAITFVRYIPVIVPLFFQ